MRFIVARVGTAADGCATPLYQVFELLPEEGVYDFAQGYGPNDPVHAGLAQERCEDLLVRADLPNEHADAI